MNNNDLWSKVIFPDERKFNLDDPDGFQYYCNDLRRKPRKMVLRTSKWWRIRDDMGSFFGAW
jgi:hypothetical protein